MGSQTTTPVTQYTLARLPINLSLMWSSGLRTLHWIPVTAKCTCFSKSNQEEAETIEK